MKGCSKGHGIKSFKIIFNYPLIIFMVLVIIIMTYDVRCYKASYTFDYAPKEVKNHAQKVVSSLAQCIFDIEK